ncbi:hypothetical protein HDC90_004675 [Pedobacter sp. AK013]|uniref:DUF262 domain-containing protein n=1 Tax=Pedobacter sp. AK013 TaxID=2723071 RepID=UPI001610D512|nr:DUF262 domain-containing protein [Pedobacter sp. AK013]MBB6240013.1 hypothetical protein [Pedobacter sp. AK013]
MAKTDTIYPLKAVFSEFLLATECDNFLIPTYQRGYKWSSGDGKGQVDRLLKDLFDAFQQQGNASRRGYYLQFITLKENANSLEVIDGQQRLTTITILFSVLGHLAGKDRLADFVSGKLIYEARSNFIRTFIYEQIDELLASASWDEFIYDREEYNNQDIYFIYRAAQTIAAFLLKNLSSRLEHFYQFLSDDVFLIINLLDAGLNSEKIFVNVNKGVKLNDEDLVKGFLITKIPADMRDTRYRITDIEMNEIRANLGRQWDEIANWCSRQQVKDFFKVSSEEKGLEWLIRMAYPDFKQDESGSALFNYFDEQHRAGQLQAIEVFHKIRQTKLLLNDWFCAPEISNLLGYALHAKGGRDLIAIFKDLQAQSTKVGILSVLKDLALRLIPVNLIDGKLLEVNYEDHWNSIYNLFLLLDIAKFLPINGRKSDPYNFSNIAGKGWSLEHIFPQNANDFKKVSLLEADDLEVIRELLPSKLDEVSVDDDANLRAAKQVYIRIMKAQGSLKLRDEDKPALGLLLNDNAKELHTIGNLALLQQNINSSLSNHFFEGKRTILVNKISQGHFVPFHTYDVFSKLVISGSTGLHTWSANDIQAHEGYIKHQLVSVFTYLKTQPIK